MTVSVNNNNQVILPDTNDVDWKATDDSFKVGADNNYGKVLDRKTVDGKYVVTTEYGELTFGAPRLEEAKRVFDDLELSQMKFSELKGFSWLELAEVVMEAEKLRRKENRESRGIERDNAMNASLNAAKKLKDAAGTTLAMGITSGVIGAVSGGVGMVGGMKSMFKGMNALKIKTKSAKLDNDLANNTRDLATTRGKLKKAQAAEVPDKVEIKRLQDREAKLETQQKELLSDLDGQISKASKDKAKADTSLKKTQDQIAAAKKEKNELPLDTKKADRDKVEKRLSKLEAREKDLKADVRIQSDQINDLKATRINATKLSAKGPDVDTDANITEASNWQTRSEARVDTLNADLNQAQTEAQQGAQVLNALQMIGGSARGGLDAGAQFNETNERAAAQELDAEATKSKAAEEEANADFQDSNRAIQAFKDCWERCEDSRNQTRQNLANWSV